MSEFKVGDYVVHPKFSNKGLYKIYEISGSITKVQLMPNGRKSYSFESDIRHATPEEIEAGKRLEDIKIHVSYGIKLNDLAVVTMGFDQGKDITHDLGDDFPIENRISPNCKVTEAHINEADKLNRLG
ncbi:hypothetical protein [Acinetobacter baumannii]|uniref:hypothetical protein n=1 Tax=Acinetobacter baumannii TaxID=470 RepID=UPI00313EC7E7